MRMRIWRKGIDEEWRGLIGRVCEAIRQAPPGKSLPSQGGTSQGGDGK